MAINKYIWMVVYNFNQRHEVIGVYTSLQNARQVLQEYVDRFHSHSYRFEWKGKSKIVEYVSSNPTGDSYSIHRHLLDEKIKGKD